jgi:hypothetical protein
LPDFSASNIAPFSCPCCAQNRTLLRFPHQREAGNPRGNRRQRLKFHHPRRSIAHAGLHPTIRDIDHRPLDAMSDCIAAMTKSQRCDRLNDSTPSPA